MSQVTEFDTEFIIANQRSEIPVLYIDDEIKQKLKIPISKEISNNTETDIVENTINQISTLYQKGITQGISIEYTKECMAAIEQYYASLSK